MSQSFQTVLPKLFVLAPVLEKPLYPGDSFEIRFIVQAVKKGVTSPIEILVDSSALFYHMLPIRAFVVHRSQNIDSAPPLNINIIRER